MSAAADRDAVTALVRDLRRAWRTGDFDALARLFHADMIIAGPGGVAYAKGAAACIASYREFTRQADILAHEEAPPVVHVVRDTGIVAYVWRMTYRRDGDLSIESGSDQLVCARIDGRWQVLYRLLTFDAQPSPTVRAAANEPIASAV